MLTRMWNATKKVMQISTLVLVASIPMLTISASKPPRLYIDPIRKG